MAKRATARARAAKPAPAGRQTRSKKPARPVGAVAEVEVVEERTGDGIDAGIAVLTALILLAAILFVDAHLGRYGSGLFF